VTRLSAGLSRVSFPVGEMYFSLWSIQTRSGTH